jgi:hypothetical protein
MSARGNGRARSHSGRRSVSAPRSPSATSAAGTTPPHPTTPSRPATPTAHTHATPLGPWESFSEKLQLAGYTYDDIRDCSDDVFQAMITELGGFTALQTAKLQTEIKRRRTANPITSAAHPTQDKDGALARHFREEAEAKIWPWRSEQKRAALIMEGFSSAYNHEGVERLRETFIAKCKSAQLSPIEIITGQYCLFADADAGRFQLMSLILRLPLDQRLPTHNWNVASSWTAADVLASGAQIVSLRTPLFPAVPALEALNAKVLDATVPVEGGADVTFDAGRIWGHKRVEGGTTCHGGGTLPVFQAADGTHHVDTTTLEGHIKQAFDDAFRAVKNLEEQIAVLAKEKRTAEPSTLKPLISAIRRAMIDAHRSSRPANNRYPRQQRRQNPRGAGDAGTEPSDF